MSNTPWVYVLQDEGLMVDIEQSAGVTVLFIDFDEAKQNDNREYAMGKLDEIAALRGKMPDDVLDRAAEDLLEQDPTLRPYYEQNEAPLP